MIFFVCRILFERFKKNINKIASHSRRQEAQARENQIHERFRRQERGAGVEHTEVDFAPYGY